MLVSTADALPAPSVPTCPGLGQALNVASDGFHYSVAGAWCAGRELNPGPLGWNARVYTTKLRSTPEMA